MSGRGRAGQAEVRAGFTPVLHLCLPEIGFSRNRGNLSKRSPSRGMSRRNRGMGLIISTEAIERLEPRE
jgi:hypothetical protein